MKSKNTLVTAFVHLCTAFYIYDNTVVIMELTRTETALRCFILIFVSASDSLADCRPSSRHHLVLCLVFRQMITGTVIVDIKKFAYVFRVDSHG